MDDITHDECRLNASQLEIEDASVDVDRSRISSFGHLIIPYWD
jgi:hypothetical protein